MHCLAPTPPQQHIDSTPPAPTPPPYYSRHVAGGGGAGGCVHNPSSVQSSKGSLTPSLSLSFTSLTHLHRQPQPCRTTKARCTPTAMTGAVTWTTRTGAMRSVDGEERRGVRGVGGREEGGGGGDDCCISVCVCMVVDAMMRSLRVLCLVWSRLLYLRKASVECSFNR